jgi:alpha-D-xyloside xylohydrolase
MKKTNRIKTTLIRTAFTLWIMVPFISCTSTGRLKVRMDENNPFPVIEITNSYGPDIIFHPISADTGSIGFEVDGRLTWISGMPDRTGSLNGVSTWIWRINDRERVEMLMEENTEGIDFMMSLVSREGPGKPVKWFLNILAADQEYFTGVFERVVDGPQENSWEKGIETALNLRNEKVEMKVRQTVSAYAPFYLSSNNYGLFVKGTWPGVFDFCRSAPGFVQIAFEGPVMEYRIYPGPSPKEIVEGHALETGPSFIPPAWAFGPWRWRDDHHNRTTYCDGSEVHAPFNSDLAEDILMMQAYDIPCSAYWIDRPWGPGDFGFDDYKIDDQRLPDFEKMITWLNGKDIELMLWICPWVYGDMADVAMEKGYGLVGRRWPQVGMEKSVVMDFSNPEACSWWGENGPGKLARMGVRGFKLDRADGERLTDSLHLVTAAGFTYRENYNDYSRQFVKATYDAVEPVLGGDFILFPRAQYTGSARYGAMWGGDTDNSAEGLRSALIGMQRCAVMGYPLWGSDAGGYPKMLDREVTIRWLGFACFSPIMEIGPTNNRGFWGMDSEPFYDNDLMAAWRFYAKLRMSLMDYIHELAFVAGKTGIPVARPLFLEYPEQEESWKDWTTYKLGDDLLVSIVWEKGKTRQQVYLPAGETWMNLWNNEEYQGGQTIEVDALPYQTPVFLRKGSDLDLPDFNDLYAGSVEITAARYRMSDLETKEGWK